MHANSCYALQIHASVEGRCSIGETPKRYQLSASLDRRTRARRYAAASGLVRRFAAGCASRGEGVATGEGRREGQPVGRRRRRRREASKTVGTGQGVCGADCRPMIVARTPAEGCR